MYQNGKMMAAPIIKVAEKALFTVEEYYLDTLGKLIPSVNNNFRVIV